MKPSGLLVALLLVMDVGQAAAESKWGRMHDPRVGASTLEQALAAVPMTPIIDDPLGDHITSAGNPIVDIAIVEGGTDGINVTLRVTFSPDTAMSQVVGFIDLDTDQDPTTGEQPNANFLILGTNQDIGVDYFLSLFNLPSGGPIDVFNAVTGAPMGSVPATILGQTLEVTIPLALLGGNNGAMDVGTVLGNPLAPTDAAPNVGHGTILGAGKASISPGSSTMVTTQVFDLVFILHTFGNPITGVNISINGVDITAAVLGFPPVLGITPSGQLSARLPVVGAAVLGAGLHTLSIVVTTPAGTFGDTVKYEIIPTAE